MHLVSLRIENFRAISTFEIDDLKDLVLIAGPNGCGKSCVFDALRLFKSAYGGYQHNEWMQWLGEFQIDPNDPQTMSLIFRDKGKPITIAATLTLSADSPADWFRPGLPNRAVKLLDASWLM